MGNKPIDVITVTFGVSSWLPREGAISYMFLSASQLHFNRRLFGCATFQQCEILILSTVLYTFSRLLEYI